MTNRHSNGRNYRILLYCVFWMIVLFRSGTYAQTPVFFEDFGNTPPSFCDQGTLANGFLTFQGPWTVTPLGLNDTAANLWFISATEPGLGEGDCAAPGCHVNNSFTNRTLHVGNQSNSPNATLLCPTGDCGAVYDPGGFQNAVATDSRAESPAFPVTAGVQYGLTFLYLEHGDDPGNIDNATVEFFDGTNWVPAIDDPPRTLNSCGSTYKWTRRSLTLPPILTSTNVKIGFRWTNDEGGIGVNPSFAVDSIIVIPLTVPVADITVSDTNVCVNDSIDFFAATSPGSLYSWSFPGASIPGSAQQNPSGVYYPNPGTYTVTLIVGSGGGTDTAWAEIVVNPCAPPVANFYASDTVFCERSCITFADASINGAIGWNWFFPGGIPSTSSAPTPPPVCYASPGFYNVTLIAFNQFGSDTIVKTAYLYADTCPLPIADFNSVPVQFCPQHCVSFSDNSANGPITSWQWSFPGGTPDTSSAASPAVCYDQEGFYDVQLIVTNQYGSDTIVKFSEVHAQFVTGAYASPDTEMYFGETYQLNAGGGVSYQWSPATGLIDTIAGVPNPTIVPNPVASPTLTTTYTVTISDSAGCETERQVTVTVLHNNDIFVPNIFSPNNDGSNDILYVRGNNIYGMRLTVFDRWGEKLFETTDPLQGWDGTYKGELLGPGVYTYVATINYTDKASVTQSGTVTLVR